VQSAVAALLLTGGASSRLGRDKATLVVGGERLCDRAARLLVEVADPVLEVGPGHSGLPTVDEGPERRGPLAAVAAGASALPAGTAALVLAVDMPLVTAALLAALADHPSPLSVVPLDATGRLQPLCARYSPTALAAAAALVEAGSRAMGALLDVDAYITLAADVWAPLAGPAPFADVDTPADLAQLADMSGLRGPE
jgi:molybdopterin-guanine dinucleotide biosynthesis protein A